MMTTAPPSFARSRPRRWRWVLLVALALGACRSPRATPPECQQILDRMVTLELAARGFRDPALVEIKQRDLRKAFAAELRECTSLPMDSNTMECIHHVASTDQMLEECFAD